MVRKWPVSSYFAHGRCTLYCFSSRLSVLAVQQDIALLRKAITHMTYFWVFKALHILTKSGAYLSIYILKVPLYVVFIRYYFCFIVVSARLDAPDGELGMLFLLHCTLSQPGHFVLSIHCTLWTVLASNRVSQLEKGNCWLFISMNVNTYVTAAPSQVVRDCGYCVLA